MHVGDETVRQSTSTYVRQFPSRPKDEDLESWLAEIYRYAEGEAQDAIAWYSRNKNNKRWLSHVIRYSAILLGGLAGLLPVAFAIWPQHLRGQNMSAEQSSLIVSLLVGVVAILVALDRFGDFSTGWIRYILTAFDIRTALQDFRMDWATHYSQAPRPLTQEDIAKAMQRAKDFVLAVERAVGDETRQWATEFQRNLAQMEKEVTAKWETREKEIKAQLYSVRTGAVQVTVSNAKSADNRTFAVSLVPGNGGSPVEETVTGAQTWVRAGLAPGLYTVLVKGKINGQDAADSKAIQIAADKVAEPKLTLLE